jgi:hypothetical protein
VEDFRPRDVEERHPTKAALVYDDWMLADRWRNVVGERDHSIKLVLARHGEVRLYLITS